MFRAKTGRLLLSRPHRYLGTLRFEGHIPSFEEIQKRAAGNYEEDPFEYTIFGRHRKGFAPYTKRQVGKGYWDFSTAVFDNRPRYGAKTERMVKRHCFVLGILIIIMFVDFNWLKWKLEKFVAEYRKS